MKRKTEGSSRVTKLLGMLRLSRRYLQDRWLETLFIVVGIALGVGVLIGMESYLRFNTSLMEEMVYSRPEASAIMVRPRRLDTSAFYSEDSVPAIRVGFDPGELVQLRYDDLAELREELSVPCYFSPLGGMSLGARILAADGRSKDESGEGGRSEQRHLMIRITTPDWFPMYNRKVLGGRLFTWEDLDRAESLLILSRRSASELFPGLEPEEVAGRSLTTTPVRGRRGGKWTILGVVDEEDSRVSREGGSLEGYGLYPLAYDADRTIQGLFVLPHDRELIPDVVRELEAYLKQKFGPGMMEVRDPAEARRQASESLRSVGVALMILAGLALLIASINVLNLFTARVLRRQRLIGMNVALGASRRLLFWQHTGESLLLGFTGSLMGLGVATGLLKLMEAFLAGQVPQGSEMARMLQLGLRVPDIVIGMTVGIVVGLIFGLYPASLAARQDPAEALRTE